MKTTHILSISNADQATSLRSEWYTESFEYLNKLGMVWRKTLPKYTEKEWLEFFPEAAALLPGKLVEWLEERQQLIKRISTELIEIRSANHDEVTSCILRELLKYELGEQLIEIDRHITRLKQQIEPSDTRSADSLINARQYPIVDAAMTRGLRIKRSGKRYVIYCPFHQDRSPSCTLYPGENRFYCFGCQTHGDVIEFVRKVDGCSFQEAIARLN